MRIDLDDPPPEARAYVDLYERTKLEADRRIAYLEQRMRQAETYERELRMKIGEFEARVRTLGSAARMASETNEALAVKLLRWAPIVDAGSRLVAALMTDDATLGAKASEDLVSAVTTAGKEPTA